MAGWRSQQCQSQDPDSWQDSCVSQLSNISRCLVECGSLPWQYCLKKINKNVRFPTHKYFFDRDVRACVFFFFVRVVVKECPTEVVCLCWRCCVCNSRWVCFVRCVCVCACFCQSLPVGMHGSLTGRQQQWQIITGRETVGAGSSAGFVYGSGPSLTSGAASR